MQGCIYQRGGLALGAAAFALTMAGCGPLVSVPTRQFEAVDGRISVVAPVYHPVRLFDQNGRVKKTLAEHGAGPWRSPDGKTIYFVRFRDRSAGHPSSATRRMITGELCRVNASGRRLAVLKKPDQIIPCEVKVSPSGRYLAIAGIEGCTSNCTDREGLTLLPRSLYVVGLADRTWQKVGMLFWPGGWEYAWSPKQDMLAFATAFDMSAMVVIMQQLLWQEPTACPEAQRSDGHSTTTRASPGFPSNRTTSAEGRSKQEGDTSRFDPFHWFGTDLLVKAPRSTVVGLWLPGMQRWGPVLRLHRPHYAGFEWLPDGGGMLLFGISGRPVIPSGPDDSSVFTPLTCHRWSLRRKMVEPLSMPQPDAFAAIPSPGTGKHILWLCGSHTHDLILTDSRGKSPKLIAGGIRALYRPYWRDDHTVCFVRQEREPGLFGQIPEGPATLVIFDTSTGRSVEHELKCP